MSRPFDNAKPRAAVLVAILCAPVFLLYGWHLLLDGAQHKLVTGFIQYDMAYYVANARQYLDGESAGLLYANPYCSDVDCPKIYFQPAIAVLAVPLQISLAQPALPLLLLGSVSTVCAFTLLGKLVAEYYPTRSSLLQYLLPGVLAWGGGFLSLAGGLATLGSEELDLFRFDPEQGWWFLNFGRNFLFPLEAFYHAIVVGLFLCALQGRRCMMIVLSLLLATSHPFTGIQYAMIVVAWFALETFVVRSQGFSAALAAIAALPLSYSVLYYLVYLADFPSHRQLVDQWALNWSLHWATIVFAYGPLFALVLWRGLRLEGLRKLLTSPFNRFLLVALGISFGLANHDLLITPHQPLHFTRGHVYLPLGLLALPAIANIWERWDPRRGIAVAAALAFTALMLSDNAIFLLTRARDNALYVSPAQEEVYAFLRTNPGKPLTISDDHRLNFLAATYSQARPYHGHWANTPRARATRFATEAFFERRVIPEDLAQREFWVLTRQHQKKIEADPRSEKIFSNGEIDVFVYRKN